MELLLDNEHIKIELQNEILIVAFKNSYIDLKIAQEIVKSRLEVQAGKKYPSFIKIKSVKESTKEARDFLASEKGCEGLIATAIYVDSILENMIGTLFIYLNKPLIPTKIFKDETKAKEWLAQYMKKD